MRADVIVDEVRRVRNELVKRYGGLEGWIEHLQAMDRERAGKKRRPTAKESAGGRLARPSAATKSKARK